MGPDWFGARRKELAAGLRGDGTKLGQMRADPDANPAAVAQMLQRVTWDSELFQDRRRALSFVYDAPGKIEQRLLVCIESSSIVSPIATSRRRHSALQYVKPE